MRSRSWMAALAFAVGIVATQAVGLAVGAERVVNQVSLDLQITGLANGSCEVEIKPGHPGCRFAAVSKRVESDGPQSSVRVGLDPILAESLNADRECAFAITVRQPGQPARTFRRGIRLARQAADRPIPAQSLNCYLSTPSSAAIAGDDNKRPRR